MRLEEIKGERHLCLIITFFVNALTSVVVTEQVPINTNLPFIAGSRARRREGASLEAYSA